MDLPIPERGAYQLLDFIDSYCPNPGVLFELGARDCNETRVFSEYLPWTQIYTFECNPQTLPICRKVCAALKNVKLVEKAVSDKDGTLDFFAIDPKKTKTTWKDGNPGASSLLVSSGKYPIEEYVQKKVKVRATRLDSFIKEAKVPAIDVLWMDIQGAELLALQGLGVNIDNVRLIFTETEFLEIYKNQPLFSDIYQFLHDKGFMLVAFANPGDFSRDSVFVNKRSIQSAYRRRKLAASERKLLKIAREKINAHKQA